MARQTGMEALREKMTKRYGEKRITRRASVHGYEITSTGSYTLDMALRVGGWVEGRIHEVVGVEGVGKTTLCYWSGREAQKKYPHKAVGYIDMEQCLRQTELVRLADGRRVPAADLVGQTFELYTSTPDGHVKVQAGANLMPESDLFRVTTETGRTLEVNGKHPLYKGTKPKYMTQQGMTVHGWTSVSDLTVGDHVAVPSKTEHSPGTRSEHLSEDEAAVLGFLVGGESIATPRGPAAEEFIRRVEAIGDVVTKNLLRATGLFGKRSPERFIPEQVFASKPETIAAFLGGLYATDGHIHIGKPSGKQINGMIRVEYDTTSRRLAADLQEALLRFGVNSTIRMKRDIGRGGEGVCTTNHALWTVQITYCSDLIAFADSITVFGQEGEMDELRERAVKISQGRGVRKWRKSKLNPDLHWEKIASIEPIGREHTVGLMVPEHHTYLSTFWEHNTFDWDWAEAHGLNTDDEHFMHVYPDDSEDVSDQIRMMIDSGNFSMIIIDSIGGMESKQALDKDAGDSVVGRNAQVITRMAKACATLARKHQTTILIVNQYRCLAEGTFIQTAGGLKEIQDIVPGDLVRGGDAQWVRVEETQASGVVPGRIIQAQDSAPLGISDNHRQMVLSDQGIIVEKLGRQMAPGDWLVEPIHSDDATAVGECVPSHDAKMALVCGLHFADGSIHFSDAGNSDWWVFGEKSAERLLVIEGALSEVYPPGALGGGEGLVSVVGGARKRAFLQLGVGTNGSNKKVPPFVLNGDSATRRQFLRGASLDTHGFSRNQFIWTGEGLNHIRVIAMMLREFGIRGSIRLDRTNKGDFWRLFVSSSDAVRFTEVIGFCEPSKQALAEVSFTHTRDGGRGRRDLAPASLAAIIYEAIVASNIKGKCLLPYSNALRQVYHSRLNASRIGLIDLCRELVKVDESFSQYLSLLERNKFFEVVGVEKSEFPAYDIQVEGGLFIAEGVLTHNSNIGGYGGQDISAGPKALKYATTTKVELARAGGDDNPALTHKFPGDKTDSIVGKPIRARVTRNKVAAEGRTAIYTLITQETPEYGPVGIDRGMEAYNIGINSGVIEVQPGGYHQMPWTKTPKERLHGRTTTLDFLRAHPERCKEIADLAVKTVPAEEIKPDNDVILTDDGEQVDPKTGEVLS